MATLGELLRATLPQENLSQISTNSHLQSDNVWINLNKESANFLPVRLCLGIHDVFIALFLVMLILLTIFGNILVLMSVFVYKRMRTFTNILLTSLASADLLVGLIVMPMSLLDLLHNHKWPLGRFLCRMWATSDVLLCTASILNLCIISLDRYFAITSPLKYPRTRSRKMAAGLLSSVWLLSFIVCSPPWIIPSWNLFTDSQNNSNSNEFRCGYSPSVFYRIYSALGSFYLPLFVMLFVYFKIFRVASEREALMRKSVGTCRLSNRIAKTQLKNNRNNIRTASAPHSRTRIQVNPNYGRVNYSIRPYEFQHRGDNSIRSNKEMNYSTDLEETQTNDENNVENQEKRTSITMYNDNEFYASKSSNTMERECHSLADLAGSVKRSTRSANEIDVEISDRKSNRQRTSRLQPNNLLQKATEHYNINGPGKSARGSKEKMVYLRERKALKTIGIVVLGFIICWMPFFIMYLVEVFVTQEIAESKVYQVLSEFFLWLGYSNSVLNPIIYTMYNGDFRRCFRDLLSFGCVQHHRRTMSVKKLHQQSTIF